MRKFTVDFKAADIGVVGRKGEHNYPVLEFLLDEDFQSCDFIVIESAISGKKIVSDDIKPDGETLTFKLTEQLTQAGHHHVQLVGYVVDSETAEPHKIMKSPIVHYRIEQSINGIKHAADKTPGLLDRLLAKVHTLLEKAHTHSNKRTIDKFRCDVAEAEGEEFPILPDYIGVDRLKYNGIYLAYCSDGGMIEDTEEWSDPETDEKFFRIHLNNGPMNTGRRDWIDIPISGTKEVSDGEPGIGTQSAGIQLQLGGSSTPTFSATDDGEGNVTLTIT